MNYKEMVNKTKQKFQSMTFEDGDTFSEMLSFWIVIISNKNGVIKTLEGNSGGLKLVTYQSAEDFKNKCSYKNIDGYWLEFMSNNQKKKSDFLEYYFNQERMSDNEIREFKLDSLLNVTEIK
jgi:hypothetical protein